MSRSYHNRILRVDLTTGQITVDSHNDIYMRRYMGGWNIIADVLLNEVPAKADPLGPENKLIFAPGVLAGLPVSGLSRNAVGAKSPLTGGFGAGEVGEFWGADLKRAGFDGIIVEGISPRPVYLWIKDDQVELRDASHLWGLTTKETQTQIQEELGDRRIHCAMIGPGGEQMVRYACIMNGLKDAAGRTGLGAVMGSKRLKAVAVRATKPLEAADPETIRSMAREMARAVNAGEKAAGMHKYGTGTALDGMVLTGNLPIRNFRDGEFDGAKGIGADVFLEQIGTGMDGCYGCAVRCKKVVDAETPYKLDPDYGGPEYESVGSLGSCCGVDDIVAISKATELCNAYSLDTIAAGVTIAFAMECFENGLLTTEDTGGLDLSFGNGAAVIEMVERIARREGLGDLLAEGSLRAARRIGHGSEAYAMQVKGQEYPMHEPRFKRSLAIAYAVSPTGADHCHALHDSGLGTPDENGMMSNASLRSMGILEPIPIESLGVDKVRATLYNTINQVTNNCLPVCNFVPWTAEERAALVRAATGWDVSSYELYKVGERALTLARVFNAREGLGSADDKLAMRSYGPTTGGALAEGGIDPEELHEAVQTYYGMMGWDPETGVPHPSTLDELGVSWAKAYLPKN
jgi:aldehyde:ferredoxin oxidoreductase